MEFNSSILIAGQLTDWNTCKMWCKAQLVPAQYEKIGLLAASIAGFIAYYICSIIIEKNQMNCNESNVDFLRKDKILSFAHAIQSASMSFSFLMVIAFLIYWRLNLG